MALENYTTYTENDPSSNISVAANTLTLTTNASNVDAQVYDDKGAAHFAGDFTHHFQFSISDDGWLWPYVVAHIADATFNEIISDGSFALGVFLRDVSATEIEFRVRERTNSANNDDIGATSLSFDTTYYPEVERDESVGTNGTLYLRIYSDSGRTSLVETVSVTLNANEDFQYVYGVTAHPNGFMGGTIANLDLNEAAGGGTTPKGPLGHPLHGPFAGPIAA